MGEFSWGVCPCGGKRFHLDRWNNNLMRPVWVCSTCGHPNQIMNPEEL